LQVRLRNFTLQPIDLMATSPIPSRLEAPLGLDDSRIYTTFVDSTLGAPSSLCIRHLPSGRFIPPRWCPRNPRPLHPQLHRFTYFIQACRHWSQTDCCPI